MDQEPVRKKRGILWYIVCGLVSVVGLFILFIVAVVIIPGRNISQRNNSFPPQAVELSQALTPQELQKRWLDGDQLAARMPLRQELYQRLRDETWAAFQQRHPGSNPYDGKARQIVAVLAYLCVWGDYYGENLFRDAGSLYMFAQKEGLEDPLFDVMLDLDLFTGNFHSHEASMCAEVIKRSDKLEATAYPVAFKFWGATNAARNLMSCQQYRVPNIERYMPLLPPMAARILTYYEAMLQEKYPPNYLFTRADGWMGDLQSDAALLDQAAQKIDEAWARHASDSPTRIAVKGAYEVNAAWASRTSGWGSQVSEKGWSGMQLHLKKAREILESAYERYPGEWPICSLMMTVVLGEQGDRNEMEKWFQRGVQANPNWYGIYARKAHYLLPRWYGSKKDEVDFARENLARGQFDIKAPLVLANNLQDYPDDFGDDFYQQNWNLLQSIFEGYLQKYPRSDHHRTLYLKFALKAKQEKIVAEQFRLLGDYWDGDVISAATYQELSQKYDINP